MLERAHLRELGGRFRILAELGQGGSSRVWLAARRGPSNFSKLVVLKSMKDELKSEPELSQMFLNEAKLAAQLSHPNIVQTNEVFEHDGLPVIVMEYLDGQSLAAILSRGRASESLPQSLQLRVLSDALAGLHAAHELKDYSGLALEVVHRDVSPHNVFVTYDGQTKVIDFGIAKLTGLAEATESGVIRGKLHYMAPEQITAGRIDRRADVYAAGIILWEMLTGVRMWRGVNEAVVMNRVLGGKLPELTAINPSVPPALCQIVARATALAPEDRFRTAADFQASIDQYLADQGQQPRTREVGDALARLFSDRRHERQSVVERELLRVSEQSDDEYAGHRPMALITLETRADSVSQLRDRARGERLRATLPWILAFVMAGALSVALARRTHSTSPDETFMSSVPASAAPTPAAASTPEVHLRVTASPNDARVVIDGAASTRNPLIRTFHEDGRQVHTVEVSAPNYVSQTRQVRMDHDQELVITLEAMGTKEAPPASPPTSRNRTTTAKRPATKAPTTAPASDCDPPYFFDERGVKKFKTRCL